MTMNRTTCTTAIILWIGFCLFLAPAPSGADAQDREPTPDSVGLKERVAMDSRELARRGPRLTSYAEVLAKAKRPVVRIFTAKMVRRVRAPFAEDLLFERIFGHDEEADPGQPMTGLGSGIIISEDGYILTNNHVIAGADQVQVEVTGDKTRHNAIVIGSDPQSDVAVIKVDGKSFPRAVLADSSKSRVGDIVFAIGSPFNYPQTVSMGIISALGRTDVNIIQGRHGTAGYENFIQTDASVNPGNSGGALVDAQGRVVGVNTAIASNTGGSLGIGFAIPINMALRIAEGLVDTGEVQRGYLGIEMQNMTAPLAEKLGARKASGVLVRNIQSGSPAEIAGLQPLDVILKYEGRKVTDVPRLRLDIAATPPGKKVLFEVLRGGTRLDVPATLAKKMVAGFELVRHPEADTSYAEAPVRGVLAPGVEVEELTEAARRALGLGAEHVGLIVARVEPNSEAARAGLARGDLIAEIDQRAVGNMAIARDQVRKAGKIVVLRVFSGAEDRYVALRVR